MKHNIVDKIMAKHSGLNEFVNGMEFLKEVHSLYKNLGGMKNYQIAKGIIKYVVNEKELDWNYVVTFIGYLFDEKDKKGITACKENIDWEQACKRCYPKVLELTKTKSAFKDLFYLIALNNNEDIDVLLTESTLSAYGWHKIVKYMVELYEEILNTNAEYAEYISEKEELSMDAEMVESTKLPTDDVETVENSKEVITLSDVENCSDAQEEQTIDKQKSSVTKKYARGRHIVLKCLTDGTETEWATPKEIEDSIGIPMGAIRKNVSRNSNYIRYNSKKYQAFYKEAC